MRFNTPLRYPGGKGKLTEFIKSVFVYNNILGGEYMEPYAGGAGIALNLLFHGYASKIHLNDLNIQVYKFWHSVLNNTDELCQLIFDTDVTVEEWQKQRSIYLNQELHSTLNVGFSTFYLNRTNRSGIILGGIIGGKNQEGNWKIDARFNKSDLITRIERIARQKENIALYNMDAVNLIDLVIPNLPIKSLVYLDPPYYVKGIGLYQNHYKHDDHIKISELVKTKINHNWIVSYDHAPEILDMYKDTPSLEYGINYSAQNKYKGAEVMFFSDKLIVPDLASHSGFNVA